jgi:hypothetical protein
VAGKIQVIHNGAVFGSMTLDDQEPSFELIHALFPGPIRVIHDLTHDTWFADLLDAPAPLLGN